MRTRSLVSDEVVERPDAAEIVLAKLRGMIAAGTQENDTILGTIAVAAHALTGATGAAIAMPRDGVVLCVGRSGETAPELGAPLNVDSGISGECLRTGRILRCDDAGRDYQVDPEVCRQLGLQSIAVVPLRGQFGRVGVLEAFSTHSYAFTEQHMDLLGRLAGLAEAAWARGSGAETPLSQDPLTPGLLTPDLLTPTALTPDPPAPSRLTKDSPAGTTLPAEAPAENSRLADASLALTRVGEALAAGLRGNLRAERRWRYLTIAGLSTILLLLLSILSWKAWYKASLPSASNRPTASPPAAPGEIPDATAGVGLTWQPGTNRPASRPNAARAAPAGKSPATARTPDTVTRRHTRLPQAADEDSANASLHSDSTPIVVDVPQITGSGASPTDLATVLSASPSLPKLGAPISQGVAGGILVRKVQPVYSPEARRLRLEGTVVLEATITEHGEIDGLKVISGHPVLAQAAREAVSKWRYTPYLLNGKPIRKMTQINITFISPQ